MHARAANTDRDPARGTPGVGLPGEADAVVAHTHSHDFAATVAHNLASHERRVPQAALDPVVSDVRRHVRHKSRAAGPGVSYPGDVESAAPILHLSLPVRDLAEAKTFYADTLGCEIGRERDGWFDAWFHGMQLTLHLRPAQVLPVDPANVRHFGVTLDADALASLFARLESRPVHWLKRPTTDDAGTDRSQTKAMIADPSGNAIELKTYADPHAAFAD